MVNWSSFDEQAYYSRQAVSKAKIGTSTREGCDDESELHEYIRQECLRCGWLGFHGSMAHSTYRTEGEFDWIIVCEFPHILLVECKTRKGKISIAQQAVHAWVTRLGHKAHVVRSIEDFNLIRNQVKESQHDNSGTMGKSME